MSVTELIPALIKARQEIQPPVKDKKGQRNEYASLLAVINAVVPSLQKYGLHLEQKEKPFDRETVLLITSITHVSGQFTETVHPMLSKIALIETGQTKAMSPDQAYGAQSTYSKRYSIQNLLGLSADDDDDADSVPHRPTYTQTPKQAPIVKQQLVGADLVTEEELSMADKVAYINKRLSGTSEKSVAFKEDFLKRRGLKEFNGLTSPMLINEAYDKLLSWDKSRNQ